MLRIVIFIFILNTISTLKIENSTSTIGTLIVNEYEVEAGNETCSEDLVVYIK